MGIYVCMRVLVAAGIVLVVQVGAVAAMHGASKVLLQ